MRVRAEVVGDVHANSGREKAGVREWGFRKCFRAEVEQFWVMTQRRAWSHQVRLLPGYRVMGWWHVYIPATSPVT